MASRDITLLHPILLSAYNSAIAEYESTYPDGSLPFCTCTNRSFDEQDQLYLQRPKVTNARSGESPHNYNPALAFDLGFLTLSKKLDWSLVNFKNFADIIIGIEPLIEWGGMFKSFKDNPHYQLINWREYINE